MSTLQQGFHSGEKGTLSPLHWMSNQVSIIKASIWVTANLGGSLYTSYVNMDHVLHVQHEIFYLPHEMCDFTDDHVSARLYLMSCTYTRPQTLRWLGTEKQNHFDLSVWESCVPQTSWAHTNHTVLDIQLVWRMCHCIYVPCCVLQCGCMYNTCQYPATAFYADLFDSSTTAVLTPGDGHTLKNFHLIRAGSNVLGCRMKWVVVVSAHVVI